MPGPFDFVNAINSNKQDLMTDTENDELAESTYVPFLTNRSLSNFPDTILYAQEMNRNQHLDNKLQFHYLLHSVRQKKRFSKWHKKQNSEDLEAVKQYYKLNDIKALSALELLTHDQISAIKQALYRGTE